MSYVTRPYVRYTLICPSPFLKYEITPDKLYIHHEFFGIQLGQPATYSLQGADFEPVQNILQRILGVGSLTVRSRNGAVTCERISDIEQFRAALEGTHSAIIADKDKERESNKIVNLTDADLSDCVLYYPHVPKAVDRLLRALEPTRYNSSPYVNIAKVGQGVQRGDVIAQYGDIKITAPYSGRIELIGNADPGKHEWPEPQPFDSHSINSGRLLFPESIDPTECHAFALRPLRDPEYVGESGNYNWFSVRNAFDHGNVWRDMKKKRGNTFYTIIDLTVCDLKYPGNGIALPQELRDDTGYRDRLMEYWVLINNASASIRRVHVST